jgi:ABC-type iron transport system FetAB permease component
MNEHGEGSLRNVQRVSPAAKDKIELLLSLGATRWEATRDTVARCVKLALTPILNQMNVVVRLATVVPAR